MLICTVWEDCEMLSFLPGCLNIKGLFQCLESRMTVWKCNFAVVDFVVVCLFWEEGTVNKMK